MLVAFLLDRTGSMSDCKAETISGFNAYINELMKNYDPNDRFTLTQFDTQGIDIVHDAVPLKKVDELTDETYQPRASTPLYDAIGKTVRATEAKAGDKYKVLFVTLTDGEENSSHEWNLDSIQKLIKEKENKAHWTFAHIGVGINGWNAARAYSVGTRSASNVMHADKGDEAATYRKFAGQTMSYKANVGACGQSMSRFWEQPTTIKVPGGKKVIIK